MDINDKLMAGEFWSYKFISTLLAAFMLFFLSFFYSAIPLLCHCFLLGHPHAGVPFALFYSPPYCKLIQSFTLIDVMVL